MKPRLSITINLTGSEGCAVAAFRIVPKPNRYSATRYWVVLPGKDGQKERWRLVPNPEQAVELISRWLLAYAKDVFNNPTPTDRNAAAHRGDPCQTQNASLS